MTIIFYLKSLISTIVRHLITLGSLRLKHGPHVTRYTMYLELEGICSDDLLGAGKKVLAISGSKNLVKIIGLEKAEIIEADYPEYNIIDLKAFDDEYFDFIVSDQVLEHIEGDPQKAFDESLRILKGGGIAIHTTCFIYPIHGAPSDFWRFTPEALRYLSRNFSEIIRIGSWGNRAVWLVDFFGWRSIPVPHARWHPLHKIATMNDKLWPIVTWVIARK